MKLIAWDVETLINCFTVCFLDVETKRKKSFVLYDDIDQLHSLIEFLRLIKNNNYVLLGFNSIAFDAQIIEFILKNYYNWSKGKYEIETIIDEIYQEAQRIVALPDAEKYLHLLPEYKLSISQLDLFKQKHYDGFAKRGTSLKWIQFTMNYPTIEEMPIKHDTYITKEQIPEILSYNWNDVESTCKFFEIIKFETDIRISLSEKYERNLLNASEPRLAKEIFGKFLCEDMNISYVALKKMRSFRNTISIGKLILPYIKFKTPILQGVLELFRNLEINPNQEKLKWDKKFTYHGIEMIIGLGGLHGCCSSGVYNSDEQYDIFDIDVASFYPNLAIVNNIKPQHLGESFSKIYQRIFEDRKKIPKKDPVNYVYKILLNSTYGLSNEKNSYFYDPIYTFSITVNGQLSLLMLIEMLIEKVPSLQLLQANTDGTTIKYKKEDLNKLRDACKEWEGITKLKLEESAYNKMVIKDVNNYIAIDNDKKVKKRKGGAFAYSLKPEDNELEYHKNTSFLIVQKALEQYFINNIDYRIFIREHNEIYDFLGAVKKTSAFDLIWHIYKDDKYLQIPQQKVTRFYVSKDGKLVKHFHDGRRVGVLTDWQVTPLNIIEKENAEEYDIDYTFYIKEAEKIISWVEGNKKQLKLF